MIIIIYTIKTLSIFVCDKYKYIKSKRDEKNNVKKITKFNSLIIIIYNN